MTAAVVLSLLAALALAGSAVLSKQLTLSMPARQLVGPLLLLNALLVAPLAWWGDWASTPQAWALHAVEAVLLVIGSWAVWDLFDHGAASATVTAQSLSPIPAVVAAYVLLPGTAGPVDAAGAAIVVAGVLLALRNAFGALGGIRRWGTVALAAGTAGTMSVTSRLLADLGVGVLPTYFVRTSAAAVVAWAVFWPHDVPFRQVPQLAARAAVVTAHFLAVLGAVRLGSPAVVQAVVATSPLLTLALERARRRQAPGRSVLVGTAMVAWGVAVMAFLGASSR